MTVVHKRGVLNTNVDCRSRQPQPLTGNEPLLPDWNKGDYNIPPQTAFAFMSVDTETADTTQTQMDIWEDQPVLHFLRTHQYETNLTPLSKDRVHRRAKGFRWLSFNIYKIHKDGRQMLLIPLPVDRDRLVQKVHRDMGHFGIH